MFFKIKLLLLHICLFLAVTFWVTNLSDQQNSVDQFTWAYIELFKTSRNAF